MLILFLFLQSCPIYLDSTLSFIGLTKNDLALRTDYAAPDPYRFKIVDSLMKSPLSSIDFVLNLEDKFWNSSEPEIFKELVKLYDINSCEEKGDFRSLFQKSNCLINEAFAQAPEQLGSVFEELTLFSPEPTNYIEEEKQSEQRFDSLIIFLKENANKVAYQKLFNAGFILFSQALNYQAWFKNLKKCSRTIPGVEGRALYYENLGFGEIVVGDTGPNIYKKDFAIIIDLGGDDTYRCRAKKKSFQIIADAGGNDTYIGENYAIACGYFGVGIIIDEKGDDTYQTKSFSLGTGVFGVGVLFDKDGNDRYIGDTYTQGCGGFGIGILKDETGNDIYEGALYAQGFASTYGIGILCDKNGNDMYQIREKYLDEIRYLDHYLSFSQGSTFGFRPDLSAGIGMILDQKGNDYYLSDIFGQGVGYWYGLGAIVDDEGNDIYVSYQYAQGAATHCALGLLIDKKGHDNYVAKGVAQGCGHDLSFGLLYDFEGDDSYVAYDLSQGAGNANGIGILIDENGDDNYSVKKTHNTQGYGDFRREYGSIGVLVDIKGKDFYTSGKDKSLWQKGKYGIGIDWD